MSNQPSGDLSVDSAWDYTPDRSSKTFKIWLTHQWVVQQLSMLWFANTLEVNLDWRSILSHWFLLDSKMHIIVY